MIHRKPERYIRSVLFPPTGPEADGDRQASAEFLACLLADFNGTINGDGSEQRARDAERERRRIAHEKVLAEEALQDKIDDEFIGPI
jgi:hypothetical protein